MSSKNLFVGLMSGTSLDGIDAVLVEIDGTNQDDFSWNQIAFMSRPYNKEYRNGLYGAIERGTPELLCQFNTSLGEQFGAAVCE
ncbi:MAG TPA: anhydro-N-acetylmuramic acid kinase, partial [Gemmatimonadetes bacterium]|nr:anhydro-N-acetylmuramic acid kinase [Gemmatimonadota bacterium]